MTAPVAVSDISGARAMPKSMMRGPSGPSRTLPGFRSRWTTPAWWMAASAVATPTASRSAPSGPSGPSSRTRADRAGPGTYSLTRYGTSPSTPVRTIRAVQKAATRRAASPSFANRSRAKGSAPACSVLSAYRAPEASYAS